uniref:Uncharacterized protein n=1 Tax=Rhizophora mucronata TaxID=61149 RepID=A0A2P2N8Z4_RHIMU
MRDYYQEQYCTIRIPKHCLKFSPKTGKKFLSQILEV